MTLDLLKKARETLKLMKMSRERKRMIWCVLVFLFMGSLRAFELLGTDPRYTTEGGPAQVEAAKDSKNKPTAACGDSRDRSVALPCPSAGKLVTRKKGGEGLEEGQPSPGKMAP